MTLHDTGQYDSGPAPADAGDAPVPWRILADFIAAERARALETVAAIGVCQRRADAARGRLAVLAALETLNTPAPEPRPAPDIYPGLGGPPDY